MKNRLRVAMGLTALFLFAGTGAAAPTSADANLTPPRLSLVEGSVSFWRPGAVDWTTAALNTPLAPGDALYSGERANLELQIGNRAFVRTGERTQLSLVNRGRDYLQFRVADGQVSIDLRALPATGLTVEVDTPNAVFTINRSGYYRLDVDRDTSRFITGRGGRATVIPAGGQALSVAASEELVVEGEIAPRVESYVAPEPDAWDKWNHARTDHLLDALSARYLPADVYGAETLDHYGDWRVVPDYGTVWVPAGLPPNWAPYSTGRWTWDSFYGWSWIDDAPWGWAPFHYGRWVYLNGFWAWTPGTAGRPSVYSPALVAFFNSPGVGAGVPALGWVALSWGEPVIPWWGRRGFVGVPSWRGWAGPRNKVVAPRIGDADDHDTRWRNARVGHAMIAVRHDQFGRGAVQVAPASKFAALAPVAGRLPVQPTAASLTLGRTTDVRPSREVLARPSVALRGPQENKQQRPGDIPRPPTTATAAIVAAPTAAPTVATPTTANAPGSAQTSQLRWVSPPKQNQNPPPAARFGVQTGPERSAPGLPPRFEESRHGAAPAATPQRAATSPIAAPPAAAALPAAATQPPAATAPPPIHERPAQKVYEAAPAAAIERGARPVAPVRAEPVPALQPVVRPEPARRPQQPAISPATPTEAAARRPEAAQKESRREDEERALPGNPANRMSPRHGAEGAQKDR